MATKMASKHHKRSNGSLVSKAGKASLHIKKDVSHYITKKPYRTMGILMLASACAGYLIHRH